MITLSYGTQTYTFANLSDHPVGFEESETARGQVARQWLISGIVSREDAKIISDLFRAWYAARILDGDPSETGLVGVTANFTGEAPGFVWTTPIPIWFNGAPQIQMAGGFCRVSLSVVDAQEALEVLLAQREDENQDEDVLELGTMMFGSAVVNLRTRPNSFTDLPVISLNPSGQHVITGPLRMTEVLIINGWVDGANLLLLEAWAKANTNATAVPNSYFLTEWTEPVADKRVQNNIMAIYYDVKFTVTKIR